MYWSWVVEFGLRVKDRELSQGLDKDGNPLKAISAKTRKYRRSAMTASGKGDPSAPPLMPARELSRTRSLLAGRALETHADFYWRFDAWTGESWGRVLAIHARKGRDVIGLSPKGVARVKALSWERWAKWKAGKFQPERPKLSSAPAIPRVGTYDVSRATFGIGGGPTPGAQSTGGMTYPEWRRYFTQPNPTNVAIPGRPAGRYNRLLAHVWGDPEKPPSPPGKAPQPKPKAPPKPVPQQQAPPMTGARFAGLANAAARSVPESDRWRGGNRVWIVDAFEQFGGGLSLDGFKRRLVEAHRRGEVTLAKLDLVGLLTPAERAKYDRSSIGTGLLAWQFIRV
jgi:hypothetical protein